MSAPTSHYLPVQGATIHYLRWGQPDEDRPIAVLTHGLGYVAGTWTLLGPRLASDHYVVYALERRGHGLSRITEPDGQYDFEVFCADVVAFLDALDIRGAYGIGHSSGATDLLLAASVRPHAFTRILAVEPTVMDPHGEPEPDPELSAMPKMLIERTRRRRTGYPSRAEALHALSTRSPLKNWHPEILQAQVEYGLRDTADGAVEMCCQPATEADMLVPVFQTMENRYPGGEFQRLLDVTCPVLVTSADGSDHVFGKMAEIAARVLSHARLRRCTGTTHFWPQERPEEFAEQVAAFARAPEESSS